MMHWNDPTNAAKAARVAELLQEAEQLERKAAGLVLQATRVVNAMAPEGNQNKYKLRNYLAPISTLLKRVDAAVGNARGCVGAGGEKESQ